MASVDLRHVYALADFVRDAEAHAKRIEETKTPETLTVDGRASLVVLDATSYQAMQEALDRAELIESLRQGIKDSEAGLGIPIEEAFARLDARYGV